MNTKGKMRMQRLLSGILVLLGFSACTEQDEPELYMYGTIPVHYIRSRVTGMNEKPVEGIRAILEYKGIDGKLVRDTAYTDAEGITRQELGGGMDKLEEARARLVFDDVDGEKNGMYESDTVDFPVKEVLIDGKVVQVSLKEKKDGR